MNFADLDEFTRSGDGVWAAAQACFAALKP